MHTRLLFRHHNHASLCTGERFPKVSLDAGANVPTDPLIAARAIKCTYVMLTLVKHNTQENYLPHQNTCTGQLLFESFIAESLMEFMSDDNTARDSTNVRSDTTPTVI